MVAKSHNTKHDANLSLLVLSNCATVSSLLRLVYLSLLPPSLPSNVSSFLRFVHERPGLNELQD